MPEGVGPVGYFHSEGFLDLGLVQNGVGGALNGRGVLAATAGAYVAMTLLGGEGIGGVLNHLCEVVPGAYSLVGVVVDAAFGVVVSGERGFIHPLSSERVSGVFRFPFSVFRLSIVLEHGADGLGEVQSIGGGAALVVDNLQGGALGGELEHGAAEVLAELRIEPCRAYDDVLALCGKDALFAVLLGLAVHSRGCALLVFTARGVVCLGAEDIVGGDVYEQSVDGFHCQGEVLGCEGIELVCQGGKCGVCFASVHIGPCGTVHYGLYTMELHHLHDGLAVGDVQKDGFLSLHLVHVGEDEFVIALLGKQTHFGTELSVGTGYQYFHNLFFVYSYSAQSYD